MNKRNVESWRMALGIGLLALARLLDLLCDWALFGELPGTRKWLYDVRKGVWEILRDFGTEFANYVFERRTSPTLAVRR